MDKVKKVLIVVSLMTIVFGCKKQSPPEYTGARDILTHHKWLFKHSTDNGKEQEIDPCSQKVYTIFNEDSTGYFLDESPACMVQGQPVIDSFTWHLSAQQDTIFYKMPYQYFNNYIQQIDNGQLVTKIIENGHTYLAYYDAQ